MNILLLVDEVQNKSICLALAGTVQAGKGLNCLNATELLINNHRMKQGFIKASLVLLRHDKDIEILMKFGLGLGFSDMAAVFADVQLWFGVFLAAVID